MLLAKQTCFTQGLVARLGLVMNCRQNGRKRVSSKFSFPLPHQGLDPAKPCMSQPEVPEEEFFLCCCEVGILSGNHIKNSR